MTATYTFDIFCSLDGYGSYGPDGDWGATGGSKASSSLSTAAPSTAPSSGWSLGPKPFGSSCR